MDQMTFISPMQLFTIVLIAMSVFGAVIAVGWPYLIPNELGKRLREQYTGGDNERRRRKKAMNPVAQASPEQAGLRSKQSESLNRLLAAFRVSERANDSKIQALLQQAGFRGRAAAVKYLAFRIISPILFFGVSAAYVVLAMGHYAVILQLGIILGATLLGFFMPPLLLKNRIDKRKIEIGRAWPDAVDLMLICVETGMSIEHAFKKVAEEMGATSIELAKEMSLTNAELSYLQERRQAYENMSKRIDLEAVQAVTGCLIQSEKYGTSLGVSLRVLAQESREMRMAAAEKKAAALPPKLTVPMIIFFLPVLFAVIITPAALQIMAT
ncbi:MAG: type II secretion system F family protein [Pseudomonadota bacterium]